MDDDRKLDDLLNDAARTYRVPPPPPLDAIWSQVEARAFTSAVARSPLAGWRTLATAIAASLAIGVVLGRGSVRDDVAASSARITRDERIARAANDPYQRSTEEFLGRTAVLLTALPAEARREGSDSLVASQAAQLLSTTRLLLDSPAARDRRVKELLEDLELVLAQVARLPATRRRDELALINEALTDRDVVPRIRSVVAEFSLSDY